MVEHQIVHSAASSAFIAKPVTTVRRREVGCAVLALCAGLAGGLLVPWSKAPKAAPVSGNAYAVAAGLRDIPVDHALFSVAGLPAHDARNVFAVPPFGTRAGSVNEFSLVGLNTARFGTEAGFSRTDHALGAIKAASADFAGQVNASPFFATNEALGTGGVGASARAELNIRSAFRSIAMERGRFVEVLAAGYAGREDFQLETPILKNSGEFGGTLSHNGNVQFSYYSGNTEPSRACNVLLNARGAEGVTTRGCGNNTAPTSARRHSIGEDIVWTASSVARDAEVGHKQAGDNTIDSGYELLNVSPSDVISAAEYDWKQASVAVTISGLEQAQNSGEDALIDLLETRIDVAEKTMQNNLSLDMYSNGTASSGKQVGGLQLLVADTPTSGTVGGINRASYSFWRNQSFQTTTEIGSAASAANIQRCMNTLYQRTARQADKVDLIVADTNYYNFYLNSLQAIQRITSDEMASAGFQSLKFMNADVVFDGGVGGGCPTNHMYFLNTNYIFWRPHRDRNMVPLDTVNSINQDASVQLIVWMGNMTASNCQLQGVLFQT